MKQNSSPKLNLFLFLFSFFCFFFIFLFSSPSITATPTPSTSTSTSTATSPPPAYLSSSPDRIEFNGKIWVLEEEKGENQSLQPINANSIKLEHFLTPNWDFYLICSLICVVFAGLAAGLTIGLVSIDILDLNIISNTDEEDCVTEEEREILRRDKKYAKKLIPLVEKHHLLLVTLLLLNSICNECLPLFLDRLVPSYVAVLLSVTFVLIFGEIVPSAIFTGSNQLKYAAFLSPLVYCCIGIFFLIAWPIAYLLDKVLGVEEAEKYRRGELKALVKLQAAATEPNFNLNLNSTSSSNHTDEYTGLNSKNSINWENNENAIESSPDASSSSDSGLSSDEIKIIHGVLEMKSLKVKDLMVEWDKVYSLSMDSELNEDLLAQLVHVGHSRIPVYDKNKNNCKGILLVKKLIVINPEDKRIVKTLGIRKPIFVDQNLPVLDILNLFQEGKSHLAIICTNPMEVNELVRNNEPIPPDYEMLGLITLEDVLEKLIKEEIVDETDYDENFSVRSILGQKEKIKRRAKKLLQHSKLIGKNKLNKLTNYHNKHNNSNNSSRNKNYGSVSISIHSTSISNNIRPM